MNLLYYFNSYLSTMFSMFFIFLFYMRASATTSHSSPHSLFFCHYPARSLPFFKLNKTNPYISHCFDRFYGLVLLYYHYVIFVKYVFSVFHTLSTSCNLGIQRTYLQMFFSLPLIQTRFHYYPS